MTWVKNYLPAIVFVVLACLFYWATNRIGQLTEKLEVAEREATSQAAIAGNVISTIAIFNEISWTVDNENRQADAVSQEREKIIYREIESDNCNDRYVPDSAVDELRRHAAAIRSRAGSGNPGQPDR